MIEENQLSQYSIETIKKYVIMDKSNGNMKTPNDTVFEIIEDELLDYL